MNVTPQDVDDSGAIEMHELLTLAAGMCPAMSEVGSGFRVYGLGSRIQGLFHGL